MDLWLLRHAAAHDRAKSGRDEDRALTSDGARRAREVAAGLAALDPGIEAVLSSRYRRALETAEAAARALRVGRVKPTPALEPDHAPADVVAVLAGGKQRALLLVGHQPLLGALVGLLVFGDERREIPLRKAGLAHIVWEPRGVGRLEALFPPKVLSSLGLPEADG
ncbi:MAG: histidine phosphatase family protein [Acidobacteriota bacterium]|nr:histidine phosphatase family protein [Acidobacteriota bacterium]MDQ5873071.1 histidine phosphatase family protein [Acidobacteriota bacterium]